MPMPSISRALAVNLPVYRKKSGLSQDELARKIGRDRSTIVRYESGEGQASFETISKLADILGVEETDLVHGGKPPEVVQTNPTPLEALKIVEKALKEKEPALTEANKGVLKLIKNEDLLEKLAKVEEKQRER